MKRYLTTEPETGHWTKSGITPAFTSQIGTFAKCSNLLLIEDDARQTIVPGYCIEALLHVKTPTLNLAKGDILFVDMSEIEIKLPVAYYETIVKKK